MKKYCCRADPSLKGWAMAGKTNGMGEQRRAKGSHDGKKGVKGGNRRRPSRPGPVSAE
ncbi:hypothetical protein DESC_760030 [Desulfosarcina cetonica]|nr:hypothetical protein DESC_760030 [Desulfosarcina cetonica]